MREIPLTRGLVALVDDDDFERLNAFKWRATPNGSFSKTFYAVTGQRLAATMMHNMILPTEKGYEVDHRDRNGLNNTRSNLRPATRSQNAINRAVPPGAVGYRGVSTHRSRFRASISIGGKQTPLGNFRTAIEAAVAYDEAARAHHGEFAVLNFSPKRDWLFPLTMAGAGEVGAGKTRGVAR